MEFRYDMDQGFHDGLELDVAIVGGGIAGLYAGWRLRVAGLPIGTPGQRGRIGAPGGRDRMPFPVALQPVGERGTCQPDESRSQRGTRQRGKRTRTGARAERAAQEAP